MQKPYLLMRSSQVKSYHRRRGGGLPVRFAVIGHFLPSFKRSALQRVAAGELLVNDAGKEVCSGVADCPKPTKVGLDVAVEEQLSEGADVGWRRSATSLRASQFPQYSRAILSPVCPTSVVLFQRT